MARSPVPLVWCDGVRGRKRMSQSLFFWGELWSKKPGHTSASPWVAAAEPRVLCLWAYLLQGVTSESAGGYCCSLKSSHELSGTCHSVSCKPWRCHWVFTFLLSRKFPKSFSAFLLFFPMSLWLQVRGTARGTDHAHLQPALMGAGAANPTLWEQHVVQYWVTGLWEECFSV